MKNLLVQRLAAFAAILCLVAGLRAQGTQQTYTLAPIEVECATCAVDLKKEVVMRAGLVQGQTVQIPGPDISKAIKNLWSMSMFEEISIDLDNTIGQTAFLVIRLKERPRITGTKFSQNLSKTQVDELREKLVFIRGTMWTPEKESKAIRVVRNYYVEKGFYNTKVTVFPEDDSTVVNGVKIKIVVDKGLKTKINEIKIDGNQDFSDRRLVRAMKDIKEKQWWRLWARSKYLPKSAETAEEKLIDFYRSQGYRDAEIVADTLYQYDDKTINVEYEVFEGRQFYIRNIAWTGNYKYSSDTLTQILGIERGEVYNMQRLEARLAGDPTGRDIATLYQDDGYLFHNVDPIEIRVEGDSVDLLLRMYEGPQSTIRSIIVEGNTKTSDYVILRECKVLPGDKFSRTNLIRSQRDILALGFFDQENFQIIPMPDPTTGEVDIKFIVQEKPSDQLQVQGGWGGRLRNATGQVVGGGFVGTVQLGFNNFSTKKFFKAGAWSPVPSGDGQKLNLAVQMNGVGWQNYSINFVEPWLGGKKPNSLGVSTFYSINSNPNSNFRLTTYGAGIDFGQRMKFPDDFFRSYTSASYKYYTIKNGASGFGFLGLDDGFINILSLKQTFDRTSLDAPMYPRSGSAISFSVEATPPWSILRGNTADDLASMSSQEKFKYLEYHKWKFSASWYHQIAKNLVVRPKVQFGYLGTYQPAYGIPTFERFFLGGSGLQGFTFYGWEYVSLRGYPDNGSVGPRDADNGPAGGNIFSKYSLELRYPLTLNQAAPIWVNAFAEAGNSWLGAKNFKPFDLKRSAGVGIRVVLPMVGMLGLDWGYGFDDPNGLSGGKPHGSQLTFTIGQEF
jgi:outer membrane protein insertion porin family